MRSVNPSHYDKKYYLSECGGFELFNKSGGSDLNATLRVVSQQLKDIEGKRVLDIGCGRGEMALWLASMGAKCVLGIDYSPSAIKIAKKAKISSNQKVRRRVKFITMDAKDVKKLGSKFDLIIMTEVYEHLYPEEIEMVFNGINKILSTDGLLLIHTCPNRIFIDYFYRYWSYPMSVFIINIWNIIFKKNYGKMISYKNIRNKYHKIMHVNEPTYFGLRHIVKRHNMHGEILSSGVSTVKTVMSFKDSIFNLLVYLYPICNIFPLNILMGSDFIVRAKKYES